MDTDGERRAQNREVLTTFLEALSARDFERLRELCDSNFVCELPYSPATPRLEGVEHYLAHVAKAFETFRFRLVLDRIHEGLDPDLLIAEYTSEGQVLPTGKAYRNIYIGVWRFAAGRITGLREFYDPMVAARALEPAGSESRSGPEGAG